MGYFENSFEIRIVLTSAVGAATAEVPGGPRTGDGSNDNTDNSTSLTAAVATEPHSTTKWKCPAGPAGPGTETGPCAQVPKKKNPSDLLDGTSRIKAMNAKQRAEFNALAASEAKRQDLLRDLLIPKESDPWNSSREPESPMLSMFYSSWDLWDMTGTIVREVDLARDISSQIPDLRQKFESCSPSLVFSCIRFSEVDYRHDDISDYLWFLEEMKESGCEILHVNSGRNSSFRSP